VRVPFLDHKIVEYCATIPSRYKVRRLETKVVLKRAARDLLPERIIHKQKIGFFRNTSADWFSAQVRSAVDDYLLDPGARYTELLDREQVGRLVSRHIDDGDTQYAQLLLSLLMLEVWLASFLPRASALAADRAVA
jgi:asparagine synthase (glutamine-hydrolysing)